MRATKDLVMIFWLVGRSDQYIFEWQIRHTQRGLPAPPWCILSKLQGFTPSHLRSFCQVHNMTQILRGGLSELHTTWMSGRHWFRPLPSFVPEKRLTLITITKARRLYYWAPEPPTSVGQFRPEQIKGWDWSRINTLQNPERDPHPTAIFLLQETYAPCLLMAKAAVIRRQTGNWDIHAQHGRVEVGPRNLIDKYFTWPLRMLISEPIILLVSLYISFIYGLVYCLLEAYPYVFEDVYSFAPGVSGLPSLASSSGKC